MKFIQSLLIASVAFTVAGCGENAKFESLREDMCECEDMKCAAEVRTKLGFATETLMKKYKKDEVPAEITSSINWLNTCASKIPALEKEMKRVRASQ